MADMFRPVPIEQEPKLKNRFTLEFPTELGIDSFSVMTVKKPTVTTKSVEIPYMNSSSYVAGRTVFGSFEITFLDTIGPSTTQKLYEWHGLQYEPATGRAGYAIGYKKNLVLKALDPAGVEVEKWTLIGCQITETSYGDYDYSSDDLSTLSTTIQPDRSLLSF